MSLLALTLVRLIRPLHVPSLIALAPGRSSSAGTLSKPFVGAPPLFPQAGPHKGWRSIQVPSPLVNPSTAASPPHADRRRVPWLSAKPKNSYPSPAASVHRYLGILWISPLRHPFAAPKPRAPVDRARDPTAPSARSGTWPLLDCRRTTAAAPCRSSIGFGRSPYCAVLVPHPTEGEPPGRHRGTRPAPPPTSRPRTDSRGPADQGWEKPTFPIINRKRGLCGRRVPLFYTFSTPVDLVVDKWHLIPANALSFGQDIKVISGTPTGKKVQIPHFYSPHACGKYLLSSLE